MLATPFAGAAPAPAAAGCGLADRVFLASLYILICRWRAGGIGLSEGLVPAEIAAAGALCASVVWLYVLPAFGIRRSSTRRRHQD